MYELKLFRAVNMTWSLTSREPASKPLRRVEKLLEKVASGKGKESHNLSSIVTSSSQSHSVSVRQDFTNINS